MNKFLLPLLVGIALVASSLVFYFIGKGNGYQSGYADALSSFKSDTVVVRDTIVYDHPVEVIKWKEKEKTVYVAVRDTVVRNDTAYVVLPREHKVYEDSSYKAEISGIEPRLEWIQVNQRTVTITNTIQDKRRWTFGVTAGPGVFYDFKKVKPGVGIVFGFGYNF